MVLARWSVTMPVLSESCCKVRGLVDDMSRSSSSSSGTLLSDVLPLATLDVSILIPGSLKTQHYTWISV